MPEFTIVDFFKDVIVPPLCAVCGELSHESVCSSCREDIVPIVSGICRRCGYPVPESGRDVESCSLCRNQEYAFYRHRSFSLYNGNLKKIIIKFKYDRIYSLGDLLAGFLYRTFCIYFSEYPIDCIYIVPGQHIRLLAEILSKLTGLPFVDNIVRIRHTFRQQGLNYHQRMDNIREAFKIRDCLAAVRRNILLIDDVWTTGSTLREICRILKAGNAEKIFILTLARGI